MATTPLEQHSGKMDSANQGDEMKDEKNPEEYLGENLPNFA